MEHQYKMTDIVSCMRNSAKMLEIADHREQKFNDLNTKQAALLRAAADDLEQRDECKAEAWK